MGWVFFEPPHLATQVNKTEAGSCGIEPQKKLSICVQVEGSRHRCQQTASSSGKVVHGSTLVGKNEKPHEASLAAGGHSKAYGIAGPVPDPSSSSAMPQ